LHSKSQAGIEDYHIYTVSTFRCQVSNWLQMKKNIKWRQRSDTYKCHASFWMLAIHGGSSYLFYSSASCHLCRQAYSQYRTTFCFHQVM